ncbi:MAG: DUF6027 family protein [Caldilineaceae bacterium]
MDSWPDDDRHANFKAEVAAYTKADPLPTLAVLSESTGIPVPSLVRYVLARGRFRRRSVIIYGAHCVAADARRLRRRKPQTQMQRALQAYHALRQIISWLKLGMRIWGLGIRNDGASPIRIL